MKDDSVVFIGGIINEDNKFKCKQQVLAFNMEFRKFYPLASLPMGCDSGVASCVYGDDIFVSGVGEGRHGLIRYVSQQNMWRVLAPMMLGRRGHVMVAHEGSLYVLGGMVDHVIDFNYMYLILSNYSVLLPIIQTHDNHLSLSWYSS